MTRTIALASLFSFRISDEADTGDELHDQAYRWIAIIGRTESKGSIH